MAADTTTSRAPDLRFLLSHPAIAVKLGAKSNVLARARHARRTSQAWALAY